jgi:DNA-binding LacI/PurR family transcriptional regulator
MVTIRDVAEAAGVAPSTVSYVLTGNKRLPQATVAKVRASALKLGYRPDPTARALSLGKTNIIGLLASVSPDQAEVDADIFMRFVRAAMFAANKHGYDLLIMGREEDQVMADPLVDALLVMDVRMHDSRLPMIHAMGKPAVLVGMPADTEGMSAVDLDFSAAAQQAVEHLTELGHRDISILGSVLSGEELSWVARFRVGAQTAAEQAGATLSFDSVGTAPADFDRWLDNLTAVRPQTTAIILHNVSLLDALLKCANERGFSIPADLSVVTLAPVERMAPLYPDLTTLDLPGRQMLEHAVERVVLELGGQPQGAVELIPPVLVTRGSTGPAQPGGLARLRPLH